jgi:hypothetical protein
MKNYTSLVIWASLTLALAGCSKHSSATTAREIVWKLGVVEVSDGVQMQRDLGGGRICTIMPTIRKDGNISMKLQLMQDGKLLASPTIIAGSDQAVEVFIGEDIGIYVTPHLHMSDSAFGQKLIGTWVSDTAGSNRTTYTISADGHWTGMLSGETVGRMEGTWLVKDGYYSSTTTASNFDPSPSNLHVQVPATNSSRIVRIDEHEFVLEINGAREVAYKKVGP